MNPRAGECDAARAAAEMVWVAQGRPAPGDLNLEGIARHLGLLVVRDELHGAAARLTYLGGAGVILVPSECLNTGRERFSIAHEVGHAWLHQSSLQCSESDLQGVHSDAGREAEANAFAAELLMPTELLHRAHGRQALGMELVLETASQFGVSATAAALGLLRVTATPSAVVVCSNLGQVRNAKVSWFKKHPEFWPSIGPIVPSVSSAHKAKLGPTPEKELEIDSWCLRPRYPTKQVLFEEVLPIASMDAALVLLTLNDPS